MAKNLTDCQAAEAVREKISWKYASNAGTRHVRSLGFARTSGMVIKRDGSEITRQLRVVLVNCWYLRSTRDADTHYGQLRLDGTVVADCGARFEPPPIVPGGLRCPVIRPILTRCAPPARPHRATCVARGQ
jgi:hypothetical protein